MDVNTFCQQYIDLAYKMLAISQKPVKIEHERSRLKSESKDYVDYLEKFEAFFDMYPSLKKELFSNLPDMKVGAFIEYQLDLFYAELKKTENLKAEIQKEIAGLRSDYASESKEWLSKEESKISNCFRYLSTDNIQQIIGFLNACLANLKEKRNIYIQEKQHLLYVSKAGERQAEEERKRISIEEARRRGIELTEQEIQERRKKAQDEYNKQMKRRKR